jgi:hypothetical protein
MSVHIADSGNNRISQLTTSGAVKVIAGTGHPAIRAITDLPPARS